MKFLPDSIFKDIGDIWTRENFFRIDRFFKRLPLFRGEFIFFELSFNQAYTERKVPHGLVFKPTDVIQTSLIGAGALTWHYDLFTPENLVISTTGPCTVRAFVGAYREG